jgi:hypothetical protein
MPRKGKGVQRIIKEEKRFQEKKKQSEKHWDSKKKLKEVSIKSN